MFGFGYKYIFKSRWGALAFAAFVCWSAAQLAAPSENRVAIANGSEDATMALMKQADRNLQNLNSTIP
jgi:hypothetical protein